MDLGLLFVAAMTLLLAPFSAVTWGWHKWRLMTSGSGKAAALLTLTTMSYALVLSGVVTETLVGPSYSDRRFATIYVNLGLMVVLFLYSASQRMPVRPALLAGTCLVALAWLYALGISAVV